MAGIFAGFGKKVKARLVLIAKNQANDPLSLIAGIFLYVLSLIYGLVLYFRFYFYYFKIIPAVKHDLKIISVGNITVGGTGKTPLVESVVEILLGLKKRVGVISRGYKGINSEDGFIADEPQMLKNDFPEAEVIVNKDRIKALETARERKCDCAVLDDALGNLKVTKNLEIVCVNVRNPFGFENLLPRGLLRLPLCYLKKADIFILTHARSSGDDIKGITERLKKHNKKALIFKGNHVPEFFYRLEGRQKHQLDFLKGKKIALVCGIAEPEFFEETVKGLGCEATLKFFFEDHHVYTKEDIEKIIKECRSNNVRLILTTAKDEPRINMACRDENCGGEFFVLKIKLEVDDDEGKFLGSLSSLFTD